MKQAKQAPTVNLSHIPVRDIDIVGRHRRDMGDLTALADSIGRLGLIEPVVVVEVPGEGYSRYRLVVGERRLRAVQMLGRTTIRAVVSDRFEDALLALRRSHIDVMLSDIAMPEKDGYELIREVRGAAADRIAALPAAAVTACVRDDEREQALAAGFQMHLAKPVHPAALVRAVATLARRVRV